MTDTATIGEAPLKTPEMRLDGKVAVVTGAGRGLGRACACAVAGAGADTVLVSRTESDLDAVAAEIKAAGGTARTVVCDVSDLAQIADKIGGLDRIDILVNNAGTNAPQMFVDVTEENYDKVMDLNVKSAVFVAQAVARKMIAQGTGGSIIHMSSQMGHVGSPTRTVYCTSKHAIEGLNKAMAVELAPHNIRVNAVGPTYIETAMTAPNFADPVFRKDALSRIPMGRIGQLDEIMGAIVFLASPASGLITGSSLTIDGGWTAQ
jgi:NAD(P)-dependent dehydrogenase (short-subunit alcohol dehydrogenase family)